MPYIIETRTPDPYGAPGAADNALAVAHANALVSVIRRAVATLDEAQNYLDQWRVDEDAAFGFGLPPEGGTVGPLPDGTVIEVERVYWEVLADAVDATARDAVCVDAYNAAQEV